MSAAADGLPSQKHLGRARIAGTLRVDDTCPSCGAAAVVEGVVTSSHGGAVFIDGCASCQSVWERETRANPALEPCSNCAWLPGSPEIENGTMYGLVDQTIEEAGIFYCHRRVPFELKGGKRFLHEMDEAQSRCTNARVCAGWIRAKLADKRGEALRFVPSAGDQHRDGCALSAVASETRGGTGDDCSVGKRGAWPLLSGEDDHRAVERRTSESGSSGLSGRSEGVTGGRDPSLSGEATS